MLYITGSKRWSDPGKTLIIGICPRCNTGVVNCGFKCSCGKLLVTGNGRFNGKRISIYKILVSSTCPIQPDLFEKDYIKMHIHEWVQGEKLDWLEEDSV